MLTENKNQLIQRELQNLIDARISFSLACKLFYLEDDDILRSIKITSSGDIDLSFNSGREFSIYGDGIEEVHTEGTHPDFEGAFLVIICQSDKSIVFYN